MSAIDFTKLAVGRQPDGSCIAKCSKCGLNGLYADFGKWGASFTHFGMIEFETTGGSLHARRARRNDRCMIPGKAVRAARATCAS